MTELLTVPSISTGENVPAMDKVVMLLKLLVRVAVAFKTGAAHGMTVTFLLTVFARLYESLAATVRASVPEAVGVPILNVPVTVAVEL